MLMVTRRKYPFQISDTMADIPFPLVHDSTCCIEETMRKVVSYHHPLHDAHVYLFIQTLPR